MKKVIALALCLVSLLWFGQTPIQSSGSKNVLIIGWDGAGKVEVKQLLNEGNLPNLENLVSEGTITSIDILRFTDTKAGWSQILTGYNPEKTKVYNNNKFTAIPAGWTILERLEKDSVYTAFIAGKGANVGALKQPTNGKLQPYYYTKGNIDFYQNELGANEKVASIALEKIESNVAQQLMMFIHFEEPDKQYHQYKGVGTQYMDAIKDDDYWLGVIIDKLKELDIYDNTLVYVVSDHSVNYIDDIWVKAQHQDAPYSFLATNDDSIIRRGDRIDIAPTIYETLGIDWESYTPALDGYPLQQDYKVKW